MGWTQIVKNNGTSTHCAWSHAKCVSLLALGFTHHKGFSYQIIELEDSGLPQQGILPISAKKE